MRRGSLQKHVLSIDPLTGGVQAPCTSKRWPHREAQAGSVENGTIRPSGEATAAAGPVWVMAWATEKRLAASTTRDVKRMAGGRSRVFRRGVARGRGRQRELIATILSRYRRHWIGEGNSQHTRMYSIGRESRIVDWWTAEDLRSSRFFPQNGFLDTGFWRVQCGRDSRAVKPCLRHSDLL